MTQSITWASVSSADLITTSLKLSFRQKSLISSAASRSRLEKDQPLSSWRVEWKLKSSSMMPLKSDTLNFIETLFLRRSEKEKSYYGAVTKEKSSWMTPTGEKWSRIENSFSDFLLSARAIWLNVFIYIFPHTYFLFTVNSESFCAAANKKRKGEKKS